MLILKYERLDFFNHRIYTEDKKENYTKEDLKKVFAYLSKTHNASIQIDSTVIFWDRLTEYENRIVTVRNYNGINYTESKKSFDKTKKEYYAIIQWQYVIKAMCFNAHSLYCLLCLLIIIWLSCDFRLIFGLKWLH